MAKKRAHPDETIDSAALPQNLRAQGRRQRAEAKVRTLESHAPQALPAEAARQVLHELQVHQIELELQNEELRRSQVELEESRARYFNLYDLAPVGYVSISETGLILEANLTAAGLLGVERSALVRQPFTHFVVPEDQDILYRHRQLLLGTSTSQTCELRLTRTAAAPFWAQLEMATAQDVDGAPVCRIVISNITERVCAEQERQQAGEALRRREREFSALVQNAPDMIVRFNTDLRHVYCNAAVEHQLGIPVQAFLGKTPLEFNGASAQAEFIAQSLRRVLETGDELEVEQSFPTPFGLKQFQTRIVPERDAQGRIESMLAITRDVTARHQAEAHIHQLNAELEARVRERTAQLEAANRELQAREEKFRTVADFTYDWEYWLGPDGNYLYVSPSCERITGYRPEEFQDNPALLEVITHPADRPLLAQHLHRLEESPAPHTMDFRILARNGEVRWIGHWCQPVYTSEGKWLGQRGSNRDITVSKQAEALQKEMEVLQQMDRLRAELIGNVSHELRSPLGVILVMVTALRKQYIHTDAEVRDQFLQDIEEEARNLQGIVENLLDESLLQSGRLALERREVDAVTLIRKTVELQAVQAPRHHVRLYLPEAALPACIDAKRIAQVLRNLLDNAVKYSLAGTVITVQADAEADTLPLRVAVSDEGPGIPPAERERIFERFYRVVDLNAPPIAGLGLGLSICRGIVEAHGGRLWVEGGSGGGSVFVFTLPRGNP
jgi:PAS domain S-box-containing protein